MANLNIVEFSSLFRGSGQAAQVVSLPAAAVQNIALTAASTQSAAFNAQTHLIRLRADTDCFVQVGPSPTAAITDIPLSAGTIEYFGVTPGQKIAARTA